MSKTKKHLKLKSPSWVFIYWANVYNWKKSLKREVDPKKLYKYILVTQIDDQKIYRRKCDFDMEMCIDVHKALAEEVESYVFFTGDGDFAPLYRLLIKKKKQVIVVYAHYHLGREIFQMKKGIYKCPIDQFGNLFSKKMTPGKSRGRD